MATEIANDLANGIKIVCHSIGWGAMGLAVCFTISSWIWDLRKKEANSDTEEA